MIISIFVPFLPSCRSQKKQDTRCSRSYKSLLATKTHRHPAYREEPFLMRARFLVHCAYYQWLIERDRFDKEQEDLRAQNGETYVKLQFRKEFPDARQMAADALVVFLEKSGPIDPALKEKMEKAARAYATTYCNAPSGASIKSCREAVGKVALARALLISMKKDPEMSVRDAYSKEMEHRGKGRWRGSQLPVLIKKFGDQETRRKQA